MSTQVRLVQRPVGLPKESDFEVADVETPQPGDGEIGVENHYVSLDPAMRGWMNDAKSYLPPVGLGEVMRAGGIGTVYASNNPRFQVGQTVTGTFGVQQHVVLDGRGVAVVDTDLAPETTWLGVLGMPGMTAYFGLLDVCRAKEGDVVVVSGAAGAVGAAVGQIAKVKGCHVVGIAGGPEKCQQLLELGFDGAIDYKNDDVRGGLKKECPQGMDVYFDNVGGEILDLCLSRLKMNARIGICGAISTYNATSKPVGPSNYLNLLVTRSTMAGFLVFDYAKQFAAAQQEMAGWLADGRLTAKEDVRTSGIASFATVLGDLFSGGNDGKLVLDVRS